MPVDKKRVVNDILSLVDENDQLRRELDKYKIGKAANNGIGDLSMEDHMAGLTTMCIEIGKKKMFNDIFYKYHLEDLPVEVDRNEGNNDFNPLTFDQWKKKISYNELHSHNDRSWNDDADYVSYIREFASNYSLKELITYFEDQLKDLYNDLVDKAHMRYVRSFKESNN